MKKNLLFLFIGLAAGAIAAALAIRLSTRTDTVFWSKKDMTVVLNGPVHVRTDADTQLLRHELVIPKGTGFNDEGVGHPSDMRFLKLTLAVPVEDVAGLFHQGRIRGGDLLTDVEMIYEPRRGGRVESEPGPDSVRRPVPVPADLGPMDSTLTARLAAPLSGWLARSAEGRPGFALSGFRRVSEDEVAIRPRPWSTNELWADSAQVSLRQQLGNIRWSPDRSRAVDLKLCSGIVVVEGDTQFYGDVDQAVILVDPGRRTYARLQSYGTGGRTEEASWLDDSTLALAGWEETQPPPHQVRTPFVRVLRLNSGQRTTHLWTAGDHR